MSKKKKDGYKPHMCEMCEKEPSAIISLERKRICLKCWKDENKDL